MTSYRSNRKRNNSDNFNLDKRMDQFIEAGRQFVDGVSGTRPGSRKSSNLQEFSRRNAKNVSQWVSKKMDSILDVELDEEYQEDWYSDRKFEEKEFKSFSRFKESPEVPGENYKRPLEAISLREAKENVGEVPKRLPPSMQYSDGDWPEESDFTVNKWHRSDIKQNKVGEDITDDQTHKSNMRNFPKSRRRRI